jgi:hypothetical protein
VISHQELTLVLSIQLNRCCCSFSAAVSPKKSERHTRSTTKKCERSPPVCMVDELFPIGNSRALSLFVRFERPASIKILGCSLFQRSAAYIRTTAVLGAAAKKKARANKTRCACVRMKPITRCERRGTLRRKKKYCLCIRHSTLANHRRRRCRPTSSRFRGTLSTSPTEFNERLRTRGEREKLPNSLAARESVEERRPRTTIVNLTKNGRSAAASKREEEEASENFQKYV